MIGVPHNVSSLWIHISRFLSFFVSSTLLSVTTSAPPPTRTQDYSLIFIVSAGPSDTVVAKPYSTKLNSPCLSEPSGKLELIITYHEYGPAERKEIRA
ncbi:hypothetical protein BDB00DRAFT_859894 [Zychaea mexicana]|uniref:uncharacterized protein n=1 Tax=Zychaea mexicana TaxID=64656 RepID=UPI0022FEA93F|nr:uncharacterized protein BDB00DRAFT_859894 [Zychaea mexicana]KAI9476628.1 hypothetical protein BDB00DRAFT_859894 [Zychaea mexicana]